MAKFNIEDHEKRMREILNGGMRPPQDGNEVLERLLARVRRPRIKPQLPKLPGIKE